jgi:hypothetical protein
MKALAAALGALALNVASAHAEATLPIDQALKIANGYLKENGHAGQTFIVGLTLDRPSFAGGKAVWVVKWDKPVALDDTKRETGLEIAMDGTYARYTEKVASAKSPATVGVPADRAALLNPRTRSDRPSILDLKH